MAKTTTTLTQSVIPAWYTNYAQQTLANQQAVANKPFTPYTGDRVAGFGETEQQGLDLAKEATTNYKAPLQSALAGTQATAGRSTSGAISPWVSQAADDSALDPAYGALQQAAGLSYASTAPTGLNMASPFIQQAGRSATESVGDYMNPYTEHVINRFGELGARTLREKLLPEISDRYVNNGQSGFGPASSGMTTESLRALRDVNDSVQSQQMAALAEGYDKSMGYAQTDAARMAGLAGTAGNLGFQQQGALQSAAGTLSGVGSSMGNMAQGQQQILANLTSQIAQAYGQDTANALAASGQLAQIAQQMQSQTLAGSQALSQIGAQERSIEQAEADAAYQEFMRENTYAQDQVNAMAGTIGAVSPAIPNAQISVSGKGRPGTNTLGTLAGLAATYAGMSS